MTEEVVDIRSASPAFKSVCGDAPSGQGLAPGQRIGRYVLEQPLGRGALATVMLARDPKLNRNVALKLIRADGTDERVRERFEREARAIATLEHPNIVRFFDYSDEGSPLLYLVMEHLPGVSLGALLAERGMVPEQVAVAVAHQLACALEYAHERRVLHRDIKPSNVILTDGRAVLVDFGGTKMLDERKTQTEIIGTPGFMSPEQFAGKRVSERTDIFSVGALMYNLTTGAIPYEGRDLDETLELARRGRYSDPREYQPLLTSSFCDLLADCLASKPAHRLRSATELRERTQDLLDEHGVEDPQQVLRWFARKPETSTVKLEERSVEAITGALQTALLRQLVAASRARRTDEADVAVRQLRVVAQLEREPRRTRRFRRKRALLRASRRIHYGALAVALALGAAATVLAFQYLVMPYVR